MEPSVTVRLEQKTDNPTAQQVAAYVYSSASGGPWNSGPDFTYRRDSGLARFETPPTLRIAQGTDDHNRAMIYHAVALIDRHLPFEAHVQIGAGAPALLHVDDILDGQNFVDFAPPSDWKDRGGGRPGAEAGADLADVKEWELATILTVHC